MLNGCLSDMMGVGLSGVSGVGKSLLASTYAQETDHQLLMFNQEILFSKTRLKFKGKGIIEEYVNILSLLESGYMSAPSRFITNVTPIDIMAELYSTFAWYAMPKENVEEDIDNAWQYCCCCRESKGYC